MITQLLSIFSFRKKKKAQLSEDDKTIGSYKIVVDDIGFYDIKIGEKFEGCACGNFFTDQTCTDIDGEMVLGTTTLAIFRKAMIRPIKEGAAKPFLQTNGIMNEHKGELSKALKLEVE